jgi:prepilin-type N-terminal cleavage/methylation domain-containing protein
MKRHHDISPHNQNGFSLIELLVYLGILAILMTLVLTSFTATMQRTAQQNSIAETSIETNVGFELLRADLEHAGFGLPWQWQSPTLINYNEPGGGLAPLADAPNNIPRAIFSEDNSASSMNNSDYLIIRATNAIRGVNGHKCGYIGRDNTPAHNVTVQSICAEDFTGNEGVIVIRPEISPGEYRQLVMDGATYVTQITTATPRSLADDDFAPVATPNDPDGEKYLAYGIDTNAAIRRPFNRTDYYINNTNVPTHCAPNTGVLVKAQVNQADDNFAVMPTVDCVADFQVVYYLDTNNDGGWDQRVNADGLNGFTAEQIRDQVKAVRCYILTHEGGIDRSYTFANATINVGEVAADGVTLVRGRSFDLSTIIGGDWRNYRWKVQSMAVTPKNLK